MTSPVGELTLLASARGLAAVLWENDDPARGETDPRTDAPVNPVLEAAALPLDEYFAGSPLGSGVEAGRSR
jgi:methylated-DNA-[protein]-cysteine S-methyltransferase